MLFRSIDNNFVIAKYHSTFILFAIECIHFAVEVSGVRASDVSLTGRKGKANDVFMSLDSEKFWTEKLV